MRPQSLQLYLGGDGRSLLFRIMGKEICFHKTGPIMMAKKYRLHDFYDSFLLAWPKQVQLISWNALLKFRIRRVWYTSRRQVLDKGKTVCDGEIFLTMCSWPGNISICLPKSMGQKDHIFCQNCRARGDEKRIQKKRQTWPVAIQYF